jgi:ABC-type hemin transport system ATPase subunit
MSDQEAENSAADNAERNIAPSITFESVTFSDGTTIQLGVSDIIVLVGPNNAGKSAMLRELENDFGGKLKKMY